jgi:hypothetical protein
LKYIDCHPSSIWRKGPGETLERPLPLPADWQDEDEISRALSRRIFAGLGGRGADWNGGWGTTCHLWTVSETNPDHSLIFSYTGRTVCTVYK